MEMHQVRYFLAVAKTCNFTRAAEECHVTQPSLSRAIQALESEFGGALFHRERGNTHLTELGRIVFPYLEGMTKQATAAQSTAKSYINMDGVPLKIGIMCTVGPAMIAELIVNFRMENPGIEFVLMDRDAKTLCEMLNEGQMDIAILGLPDAIDDRFHSLTLFHERFMVLLPRDHRLAANSVVMAADLHQMPYANRALCEFRDFIGDAFAERGIMLRRVFSSERDEWVRAMVRAGIGIGLIPEFSLIEPDLVMRPLVDPDFARQVSLVTVRGRPHSPSVGAFVSAAKSSPWPRSRENERISLATRAREWLHDRKQSGPAGS